MAAGVSTVQPNGEANYAIAIRGVAANDFTTIVCWLLSDFPTFSAGLFMAALFSPLSRKANPINSSNY